MGYGFSFDIKKCISCHSCEVACAQKNDFFYGYRKVYRNETRFKDKKFPFFLSLACNHCENPECFRVCPERLYVKRRDGIVIHNIGRCKGCTECVKACPYDAPKYNSVIGKVSKCNFCVDLLEQDMEPRCVNACVTGALKVIKKPFIDNNHLRLVFGLEAIVTRPSLELIMPEEDLSITEKGIGTEQHEF
ncbi:anaerobic dimethyl sulfoxide reductase subunit B (iron-sulfur subunit) [Desulfohalotomaculum tongense]|uniref:4Fe-4S dicluster domain-containing protein n=1 Tax=Desulforadius tongensis TaxID=1216062 RepID=UPI00195E66C2|nr:4Fe-4S dicluster domain-containing protein [Desulforadius tongensis]MBM7854107.1 anaerobic dimethyl sulfoxide reductase subunit B (iron-sulfur subunit) [Desulforadius tongensis]